jgi:hypothetical protein
MKLLQTKEPINITFKVPFGFKNRHCILSVDSTHVMKQVGEAHLMFLLI